MTDEFKQSLVELDKRIDNIPTINIQKIKNEEIVDEVDSSSLVGIGLTIAISALFLWQYR